MVKRGVSVSLDSSEEAQVNMSHLFARLVQDDILPREQCALGFSRLLETAADLSLDIPAAPQRIQHFIHRARESGILPETFEQKE